ncbi:hypothetical protein FI667_g768, partial [Globisporangium splendens]
MQTAERRGAMPSSLCRRNNRSVMWTQRLLALVALAQLLGACGGAPFDVGDTTDSPQQYTVSALFQATGDAKIGPGAVAIVAIVVGLGMCAAGYRLFRASVFVCGFLVGGLAISRAVENVFKNKSYLVASSWISFFAGGILCGCILVSFFYAGIFIVGAACGILLAITFNAGIGHKIYASNPDHVLIALEIILGLVGGMAAVCLEKPALIIITSFVGAGLTVWGVGYFAGDFPSGDDLKRFRTNTGDPGWFKSIPSAWWGYFAALVVLTVLGTFIQRHKTGRDGYYDGKNGFVTNALSMRRSFQQRYNHSDYGDVQTPTSSRRRHHSSRRDHEERRRRHESDFIEPCEDRRDVVETLALQVARSQQPRVLDQVVECGLELPLRLALRRRKARQRAWPQLMGVAGLEVRAVRALVQIALEQRSVVLAAPVHDDLLEFLELPERALDLQERRIYLSIMVMGFYLLRGGVVKDDVDAQTRVAVAVGGRARDREPLDLEQERDARLDALCRRLRLDGHDLHAHARGWFVVDLARVEQETNVANG